MSYIFGKGLGKRALWIISALFIGLVLATGINFEKALADEADDNLLAVGKSILLSQDTNLTYPLWIGNTKVTEANKDDVLGDGTVSFDPDTKTLTLNGYSYKGAGHEESALDDDGDYQIYRHSPIFWNDEESAIAIELKGVNEVTVTGGPEHGDVPDRYYGVFSAGGLAFKGSGSLAADASGIEQPDEDDSETECPEAVGIHANHDVSIESGSVSATGCDFGIESYDGIIAIGKGAGTVTAKTIASSDSSLYAIYAQNGSVRIDGGLVTAIGYTGIYTAKGIVVNGGDVTAQTNVPDTFGGSIMAPSGIYCENAQVIVNGGSVNAKGFDYGIYSGFRNNKDDEDDDESSEDEGVLVNGVIVNGGSVIAEATGPYSEKFNAGFGIMVDGRGEGVMSVSGGSVQAIASGEGGFAISAPGSVTIAEGTTSLVATGTGGAFAKDTNVKNAVAGIGWTNAKGTEGKTAIEPNTAGQTLNVYKKVQFPVTSTKGAASTVKSATAKTGDSVPYMVFVATAIAALVAAVIALVAKSRKRD